MFLFSPLLLRELKLAIDITHFLKVLPFRWNKTNGLIDYVEEPRFGGWNVMKYIVLVHGAFYLGRYIQIASVITINKLPIFILEAVLLLNYIWGSLLEIFIMKRGRDLIHSYNAFLKYYIKLQGKFRRRGIFLVTLLTGGSFS